MKAVILAGGFGTRLSEETDVKPKPMVEIGGLPILWHIMKTYSHYGINEFVVCCGYKGYVIKEFFSNYFLHQSDVTFELKDNKMSVHEKRAEPWTVTLVDTGASSQTGGRLLRVKDFVKNEKSFCFTYGDGLSSIPIDKLIKHHESHGKSATLSAVFPPGRFGALELEGDNVVNFKEKPRGDGARINGGYFVLNPSIFDYLKDDNTIWEQEPLQTLASNGELAAYRHDGFWHPMDTLRDKHHLESLWAKDICPWKVWN
jgi:glucose-1-phosphate cytidylyltransferase